jgi:hypothetical protein
MKRLFMMKIIEDDSLTQKDYLIDNNIDNALCKMNQSIIDSDNLSITISFREYLQLILEKP